MKDLGESEGIKIDSNQKQAPKNKTNVNKSTAVSPGTKPKKFKKVFKKLNVEKIPGSN